MDDRIDLVVPMVFPQDPEWQANYTRARGGTVSVVQNVRFRSWNTEELLLRCCIKYMPWVRCIHLLLASPSQVQPWMMSLPLATSDKASFQAGGGVASRPFQRRETGPVVRLCFHRDFMPARVLPCFNVNTIEMFLHKIPDLAEHFIYSNDDLFPLSALQPGDFFRPSADGLVPCLHIGEAPYPAQPNIFHRFVMNGLNMVAGDFGKQYRTTWLKGGHSMTPMLRSTVEEVCRRHADRISKSFTPSRSDRNFNQYIFPFYQYFSGRYVDHVPLRRYIGPGTPTASLAAMIADPAAGVLCINDHENIEDWVQRAAAVRRAIREKLAL